MNQLLQSQENFKHTLSLFANEVSLLKTTLTPSSPHTITQQQTYTPLHQQPTPSLNHTQHTTSTTEPTLFNTTHIVNSVCEVEEEEKKRNSDPVTKVIEKQTPTPISPPAVPLPLLVQSRNKIIPANEFASEIQIPVSEINKNEQPYVLVVDEGDFSLTVKSISQVGEEETKRVSNLDAISNPKSGFVEEQKRDVIEVLKTLFSATTTMSTETKITCVVVVAETPHQQPLFTVDLPSVQIVFDPGGTVTPISRSTVLHHSKIWCFKGLPLSVFINQISISSFDASPDLHVFSFMVFDPRGDEY